MTARQHITDAERRQRLVSRQHLGRTAPDVDSLVSDLVGLHSSDPATPYLAAWARLEGMTVADLDDALHVRRSLWRLHSIRRTIWVVPRTAAPSMLGAATVAIARRDRARLNKYIIGSGITADPDRWLESLAARVLNVLDGADPMSTRELGRAIPELATTITMGSGKWSQQQPVASRLLYLMAQEAHLVRCQTLGSWRASQYRWSRTEQWFDPLDGPLEAAPEPDAREDLVRWYLQAFGPATTHDIRWWTGWAKSMTVSALERIAAVPVALDDGGEGWVAADDADPAPAPPEGTIALLPGLDPTAMGWTGRTFYLGDHTTFGGPLFDRNGNVGPTAWLDGRVVGGWTQRPTGEVVFRMLEDVGADAVEMIRARAADLQGWLGEHVVTPRFPTPLDKEMRDG